MASRESSQSLTRIEEELLAEKIALWPRRRSGSCSCELATYGGDCIMAEEVGNGSCNLTAIYLILSQV